MAEMSGILQQMLQERKKLAERRERQEMVVDESSEEEDDFISVVQEVLQKEEDGKVILQTGSKNLKLMKAEEKQRRLERKKKLENFELRNKLHYYQPEVLNFGPERSLKKIATKGMVQLFNLIREEQKGEAATAPVLETKTKEMTKESFVNMLKEVEEKQLEDNEVAKLLRDPSSRKTSSRKKRKAERETNKNQKKFKAIQSDFLGTPQLKEWDIEKEVEDHF